MTDERLTAEDIPLPGGDFRMFITRLSFQGLMSCGVLENPITKTKQANLPNARLVLEDLVMLQDKTAGNLEPDESAHLDKVVGDLRTVLSRVDGAG